MMWTLLVGDWRDDGGGGGRGDEDGSGRREAGDGRRETGDGEEGEGRCRALRMFTEHETRHTYSASSFLRAVRSVPRSPNPKETAPQSRHAHRPPRPN